MIEEKRKEALDQLVAYIVGKMDLKEKIFLNFICTHNSRRSHLAQIWAQVAADEMKLSALTCFSGGTEATAMFPKIAVTLAAQGLQVLQLSEDINPVYALKASNDAVPIIAFSKKYDHPFNPSKQFAAIMTCDHADQNCPLILGAEKRISITYEDPKISDGTAEQDAVYLERSEQVKAEMYYVFSEVRKKAMLTP